VSNFLAIATVTETFRQMLDLAVSNDINGAMATAVRPGGSDKSQSDGTPRVGVNVYLYRVSPNPFWRNHDLPIRRSDGTLCQRPRVALDLHYLLTFYGDEKELEPQRVLGSVLRTLHAHPVLTELQIRKAVSSLDYLSGSDLFVETEQIKFTPLPLSLEELYNLWSGFFQTPYTLSMAYLASVVFVEGDESIQAALPVRARSILVSADRSPIIEKVLPEGFGFTLGLEPKIIGSNLHGDVTRVRLGDVEVEPSEVDLSWVRFRLTSPPFPRWSLKAGVQSVQVIHRRKDSESSVVSESNLFSFVLHPVIKDIQVSGLKRDNELFSADLAVKLSPPLARSQRVVLMLNEIGSTLSYVLAVSYPESPSESVTVSVLGLKPGNYLARVRVDGAESPLDQDSEGKYVGPMVKIE
jgi:hypothetical protein